MAEYNKIISTVNSITQDLTIIPDSTDVMVIDTSNNRIGINTIDPGYSIHVKDNISQNISGIISTDYLKVDKKVLTDLIPDTSNLDIGSPDKKWNSIFVKNIVNDSVSTTSVTASDVTIGGNTLSVIDNNEIKIKTLGFSSVHNKVDLRPEIYVHKTLDVSGINVRDANEFTFDGSNQTVKIPHNIDISKNSLDASYISVKNNAIIDRDVTIKGNITIEGKINSDNLEQKIEGSRASIILRTTATGITRDDLYSSYRGTTRLLDFSNQDVGIRNDLSGYTFHVTVSNGKYVINGLQTPILTLYTNTRYIFNQTDSTNNNHPFNITGGTYHNNDNSMVSITTPSTVGTTYYYCMVHGSGMGANINLVSPYNNINIKFVDYSTHDITLINKINQALNSSEHNTFDFTDSIFQVTKSSEVIKMETDFSGIVIRESYTGLNLKFDTETQFVNNSLYDISLIIVLMKNTSGQLQHIDNSPVINLSSGSTIGNEYTSETQTIAGISGDVISFGYLLYSDQYSDQYSDSSINKIIKNFTIYPDNDTPKATISTTEPQVSLYTPGQEDWWNIKGDNTRFIGEGGDNPNDRVEHPFKDSNDISYNWKAVAHLPSRTSINYNYLGYTWSELYNLELPTIETNKQYASNITLNDYSDGRIEISNNEISILYNQFDRFDDISINIDVNINNLKTSIHHGHGGYNRRFASNYWNQNNTLGHAAYHKFRFFNIIYLIKIRDGIETILDFSINELRDTSYSTFNSNNDSLFYYQTVPQITINNWKHNITYNIGRYDVTSGDKIHLRNLVYIYISPYLYHSLTHIQSSRMYYPREYSNPDGASAAQDNNAILHVWDRLGIETNLNELYVRWGDYTTRRVIETGDISFNVNINYSNIYNFKDIEINVQDVKLELTRETGQLFESIEVQNTLDASMIDANQINVELLKSNTIDCSFITCTERIDCSFIKAVSVDFSGISNNPNNISSGYLYKDANNFIKIKP